MIQNEIVPQTVVGTLDLCLIVTNHGTSQNYVEHDRKCIVALKHIVSAFSAMHRYAISYAHPQLPPDNHHYLRLSVSDLAQVLNITSSQLYALTPSVNASVESASFAERLDNSFASLIQPHRYTSHEISSSLRPITMLFGCPLPDEFDGASIGQRAVARVFATLLSSAAEKHPKTLYEAICDAHKQQGNDIKLVKYLFMCSHAMFAHVTVT